MTRLQTIALGCLVAIAGGFSAARAATPSSGTLNDSNLTLTFSGGPFTGGNPTNNVPEANGPDCAAVPNSCDDFLLTTSFSPAYLAANPGYRVVVRIDWDATNPANDFDLYVFDPATMVQKVSPSATSANPEIVALNLDNSNSLVRVGVFSAVNVSYTATVYVGPPPAVRSGTYVTGTDVWSCNTHLGGVGEVPGPPPTVFDHSNDGEPAVRFDANGKAYITGIAGVPAGAGLWTTTDACGQAYEFFGAPDAGIGGGDAEIEISPEPNILGFQNIMMSSLTLANLTTSVSIDGGQTFTVQPISTITPAVDRQWNAAYGANTFYMSYRNGATSPGSFLEVVRWDNGGLGTPGAGPFVVWGSGVDQLSSKELGNMVCDQRPGATAPLSAGPNGEGTVYHGWLENPGKVWVSRSQNFGVTWTHHLVFDGGAGASFDHKFMWVAVDKAGNVYAAFSDDHNVYYSYSTNQGVIWSSPTRVNAGGFSRTAIFPQMAAGSAGKVVFTFYGHGGSSSQDPNADWKVFVVRCQNALAPVPTFEEQIVSDRQFHSGPVCQDGLACACCRELTECYEIDINPQDGSALLCYGAFGAGGLYITRQIAGQSSIDGEIVADHSADCPSPANACVTEPVEGDPCAKPGVLVVADADADDVPPAPTADSNIQEITVSEPYNDPRGDVLVWRIKVTDLDTANLPPNRFWRIIWGAPDWYVSVVNCATGGVTAEYGSFDLGSVSLGPADHFELSDDGEICIWIQKSKVGNPAPGSFLTGINADCRQIVGDCPTTAGAFAPLDVTNSGQYQVVGNQFCAGPAVECPADFAGVPTVAGNPVDYPLTFQVSNPSNVARTFLITLQDDNNWLLGGPTVGPLGPIPPGGSAEVNATVRMNSNCQPRINDSIYFDAVAQDNSSLAAACTTVATCEQPVPTTLTAQLTAIPAGGGVDLTWALADADELTGLHIYRGTTPAATQRLTVQSIQAGSGGAFTWHDSSVPSSGTFHYRLTGLLRDGTEQILGTTSLTLGGTFALRLVGSNPVRNHALLEYSLQAPARVRLDVYGINGSRVKTLVDRSEGAGAHTVGFDLRSDDGRALRAGVYLVRLSAGAESRTLKLVAVE